MKKIKKQKVDKKWAGESGRRRRRHLEVVHRSRSTQFLRSALNFLLLPPC
jgi:hypothetical protein